MMIGTALNALGILLGGLLGLMLGRQFVASTQLAIRGLVGVGTVFIGLRITWESIFNGSGFQPPLKQLAIVVLALALGRAAGSLLRIQELLNRLGHRAGERFKAARPDDPNRLYDGFMTCMVLFCAGPLGPVGAVLAGLMNYWEPLAIKMVMDGLAAMGFVCVFGWGVVLSALPVFVFQGAVTLAANRCQPFLEAHHLLDSTCAVGGLLVFCVALIVLQLKKLDLAEYLPSLVAAPLIAWLWQ
jgi:hypothetical protein